MAQYFVVLASFAAQPSPGYQVVPKGRGQQKQISAKNLLDDLLRRAEQIQAFLDDL